MLLFSRGILNFKYLLEYYFRDIDVYNKNNFDCFFRDASIETVLQFMDDLHGDNQYKYSVRNIKLELKKNNFDDTEKLINMMYDWF